LLSLAEHIEFRQAYLCSALASVTLIALYSSAILKSRRHGGVIFMLLSALYGYLYLTLKSEAYALLAGAIGLFSILAFVMYLSRNVDWHRNQSNLLE
jgi:inner membrane protein